MDLGELRQALARRGALQLRLKVAPKSRRTGWAGSLGDGTLKVRLQAPPERGKANEELIGFLAGEFGVPRLSVRILAGQASQAKLVEIRL